MNELRGIAFVKQGREMLVRKAGGGWTCAPCASGSGTCCVKSDLHKAVDDSWKAIPAADRPAAEAIVSMALASPDPVASLRKAADEADPQARLASLEKQLLARGAFKPPQPVVRKQDDEAAREAYLRAEIAKMKRGARA